MLQPRVIISLLLFSVVLCSCEKPGCTHPESFNYDPDANLEDGSCVPKVFGCMDSTSINYVPTANTDDGSCIPKVYGCTYANAVNYNPDANVDDGTCECNRDMFYGTYNIHSICAGVNHPNSPDTSDFVWVIYADSSDGCSVIISSNTNVSRMVSGNHIIIPTSTTQGFGWISQSGGSITLSGDSLFIYTFFKWSGDVLDSCNMIGIKQ
jgi:hypothetical protein